MALPHAILVSLSEQSGSGYELARRFDRSIGYFWSATHQQIYRTLRVMEDDGWVQATPVVQQGRPDKKVYTVAEAGRAELARWIAEPLTGRGSSVTDNRTRDLAVKIRAAATAMSPRCVTRSSRCGPNVPRCSTPTADSRKDSSPTPARSAAARCINTSCCAAAFGPKRVPSNGSTK